MNFDANSMQASMSDWPLSRDRQAIRYLARKGQHRRHDLNRVLPNRLLAIIETSETAAAPTRTPIRKR